MKKNTEEKKPSSLASLLRNVSEAQFWAVRNETPHYNRVFANIAKEIFADSMKTGADLLEAISKADSGLNMSSFQRAVAKEAEHRKNPPKPKAVKQPKPAKKTPKKKAAKSKLL